MSLITAINNAATKNAGRRKDLIDRIFASANTRTLRGLQFGMQVPCSK